METITLGLKLVVPKTYFTKFDSTYAYYTIPIAAEYQKYLKFSHRNDLHQFTCLPKEYCHGPRKFTRSLKRLHIRVVAYLDACINMSRVS